MPRNKNRFSRLNQQLQAAGTVPSPDSKLGKYYLYRIGQRKLRVTNKTPLGSRVRRTVGILPFGITEPTAPVPAASYLLCSVSEYSLSGLASRLTGISKVSDLGWPSTTVGATPLSSLFYPALASVRCTRGGAAAGDRVSDITGVSYKYTPARSFGIPFGRIVSSINNDYTTQRNALSAKLLTIAGVRSVSFQNEVFRATATLKTSEDPLTAVSVT